MKSISDEDDDKGIQGGRNDGAELARRDKRHATFFLSFM